MSRIIGGIKDVGRYAWSFVKLSVLAVMIGIVGGVIGSAFHISVDRVTELRLEHGWIILLLPLGGVLIAWMYRRFSRGERIDTNRVLDSVREKKGIPPIMLPLIFISTVITHMLGGSAGREGAALQLGGSSGSMVGKIFRLGERDLRMTVMAGMSAVFSALFGTPLTAAMFTLEVTNVGSLRYTALLPCTVSAISAFCVARMFGVAPVRFSVSVPVEIAAIPMLQVVLLAVLCACVSILFCSAIKWCEAGMRRILPNIYLRAAVGAGIVILLTALVGSQEYNGAGMDVISRAMAGDAGYAAFIMKIIFTAVTISSGFKGGEIVPTFFIGSTFGCAFGALLGLDAGFAAALGFVALFCGVVNCPVASLLLSVEVFGAEGIMYFAIACVAAYILSGNFGLYKSQRILYSKMDAKFVDSKTR